LLVGLLTAPGSLVCLFSPPPLPPPESCHCGRLSVYFLSIYSITLRVFIIGLHYTAWALVKTVELSTIQLSLVGILYCTLPYVTYCFGLALLPNQIKSLYVQCDATITVRSSVLHLIIHFMPLSISYKLTYF